MRRAAAAVLAVAALAGCGDDEKITAETVPGETAATQPPPDPTGVAEPESSTVPPAAETTAPQTVPGSTAGGVEAPAPEEGGDEEAIRVPAEFEVTAGAATPATVSVPAFLNIELRLRSADGKAHDVTVAGVTVAVPATGQATGRVPGLKAGDHPLTIDGRKSGAVLRAGAEPGP